VLGQGKWDTKRWNNCDDDQLATSDKVDFLAMRRRRTTEWQRTLVMQMRQSTSQEKVVGPVGVNVESMSESMSTDV
jgi:hypothetical protein